VPDFLTPPPAGPAPTFQEQLGEIRETPPAQVAIELERCRGNDRDHEYLPVLERLIADPRAARDVLADCLEVAWHVLVAPFWARISALIEADIEYRSWRLAVGGLGGMLDDLHPAIGWADGAIRVDAPPDADVELGGRGLVLMPSAYLWPKVAVVVDEPWQPTLVYPARGVGELWGAPDAATHVPLTRLLGRTRALLLTCLDTPASTTALAGRLGRSASGVSGHLVALRDAGLVKSARHGHEVRYSHTELGANLVRGSVPP
jgi:DNA-binding transcriptional ArsR family regulator